MADMTDKNKTNNQEGKLVSWLWEMSRSPIFSRFTNLHEQANIGVKVVNVGWVWFKLTGWSCCTQPGGKWESPPTQKHMASKKMSTWSAVALTVTFLTLQHVCIYLRLHSIHQYNHHIRKKKVSLLQPAFSLNQKLTKWIEKHPSCHIFISTWYVRDQRNVWSARGFLSTKITLFRATWKTVWTTTAEGGVDKHQRAWCGWRWLSAWYLLEETESLISCVYMQATRWHSELYNDSTCFFHVVSESDWCLETKARPAWLHHVDHVHSPAVISHG